MKNNIDSTLIITRGSRVKTVATLGANTIGIVTSFQHNVSSPFRVIEIKVESSNYFRIGAQISSYEKDLVLIRPTIDPASTYQYCIKCDVLTANKPSLCCEHKC